MDSSQVAFKDHPVSIGTITYNHQLQSLMFVLAYFSIADEWSFGEYHTTYLFNSVSDENTGTVNGEIKEAGSGS